MTKKELEKLLEKNKEHLVAATLEAMKESLTFRSNSRRTDIVIKNNGEVSRHFLTSPSDELLGVVEGYMLVVASVSMSDISDWANEYFTGSDVPDEDGAIEVYLDEYTSDLEEAADKTVEQGIGDLLWYCQE